jgi:hypothetical protein
VIEIVADTLGINLADSASDERILILDQRCSELYNLIVQPNKIYVGWQYFRLEWVRLLGHALAWVIIYLRRHCFWDEAGGELRDTFTLYKKELAAAINQTPRNLANLMDHPHASLFFTLAHPVEPSQDLAASRKEPRNKPTVYRVRMVDEPLTPGDQQQVALTLRQRLQDEYYGQNPENGQLNLFPMLDRLSNRQNFAYGQVPEKMPDNDQKECRLEETPLEKIPQYAALPIGKNAATLKDSLIIPSESGEINQQQIPPAVAIKLSKVEQMLDDLSVQEPARSKLLANPDLTVGKIGAWFLYAETQPNLTDPHSYVIKRLLLNDPPPKEFLAFASLDDPAWSLFEATAQTLRMGQTPAKPIPPTLLDTFVSWAEIYAALDPAETKYLLSLKSEAIVAKNLSLVATQSPQSGDPEHDLAHDLWRTVLTQLQLQMTRQTFDTWLKPTEVLDYQEGVFLIDAKSAFAKDWLENKLIKTIETTLSHVVGEPTRVRFALPERQD